MQITWHGLACFKLQSDGAVVLTDPLFTGSGLRGPRLAASIITLSHAAAAKNLNLNGITPPPLVANGPGEYEAGGVLVEGIATPAGQLHTCYRIVADGITVTTVGDLAKLPIEDEVQALAGTDVLLLPVGGGPVLDAPAAAKLVSWLEPRVVVPCYFKTPGLTVKLNSLDKFCQEIGTCPTEELSKLKLSRKDLPAGELRIVILSRS